MKNITVRKIVLYSIALLSAIMLLIGLSFGVSELSYAGAKEGFDGFETLSFEFPVSFSQIVELLTQDNDFLGFYETMFGITSLLTLVSAILFLGLIVLAFFKFDKKKGEKLIIVIFICSIIIAIIHAIFPIIFNAQMNSDMKEMLKKLEGTGYDSYIYLLEGLKFKTSAFVPLIFQVVLLVGYIVCSKVIKEKEKKVVETSVVIKEENKTKISFEADLSFEYSAIELLKEYKNLHSENIITDAEYMDKRVKLTNYANEKMKQIGSTLNKIDFDDLLKIEKTAIQILREYKKLLESQIISDSDYIAKKVALLSYVIK